MNYKSVCEVTYGEFSQPLQSKILNQRIPITGTLELTYRCNLDCPHCYCNQPKKSKQIEEKELSTLEIFKILDALERRGCLWLLLTGGEPLLRDDFSEIYSYAKKKGFLISLFTNGTLITREIADFLSDFAPAHIEITLYGATKAVYEQVTGVSGSFKQCREGIRLLLDRGIHPALKTMVTNINKRELGAMKQFARSLGVDFRFDSLLHPRINGSKSPTNYRISAEEIVKLDIEDSERLSKWKKIMPMSGCLKKNDSLYPCGAGMSTFFINPYGDVGICSMIPDLSYNIKKYSFDDIWDSFFPGLLGKKYNKDFQCRNCELDLLCPTCPGWSALETGNPESKIDYFCDIAKRRKQEFSRIFNENN